MSFLSEGFSSILLGAAVPNIVDIRLAWLSSLFSGEAVVYLAPSFFFATKRALRAFLMRHQR